MRARTTTAMVVALALTTAGAATAEVKPAKVDVTAFRGELLVLRDGDGATYVVKPPKRSTAKSSSQSGRVWFALPGKPELYEQTITGHSMNGPAWSVSSWAPRVPELRPAQIQRKQDGSYVKWCGLEQVPLSQLTGTQAKAVIDGGRFLGAYFTRTAHMLARDDRGIYYYVDRYRKAYGGKGFRVFVGKKGAMKLTPLSDVASDSAGEVYSTKSGDLRLSNTADRRTAVWIRGARRTELVTLDVHANSVVIYKDLGVYKFLGTLCGNL